MKNTNDFILVMIFMVVGLYLILESSSATKYHYVVLFCGVGGILCGLVLLFKVLIKR